MATTTPVPPVLGGPLVEPSREGGITTVAPLSGGLLLRKASSDPLPFTTSLVSLSNPSLTFPLTPGKYVIGRSAVPVDDQWFINLESPSAAVSRTHATVILCRNGDGWVEDNCSTNGTFLVIREGEGLKLEPQHFYQLSSGAVMIFGDTELRYLQVPTTSDTAKTSDADACLSTAPSAAAVPPRSNVHEQPPNPRAASQPRLPSVRQPQAPSADSRNDSAESVVREVEKQLMMAPDLAPAVQTRDSGDEPPRGGGDAVRLDEDGLLSKAARLAQESSLVSSTTNPQATSSPPGDASRRISASTPALRKSEERSSPVGAISRHDATNDVPLEERQPPAETRTTRTRSATTKKASAAAQQTRKRADAAEASPAIATAPSTRLTGKKRSPSPLRSDEPSPRRHRRDDSRTLLSFGSPMEACLSGFDTTTRRKYGRVINARGGRVNSEWDSTCNLLVVSSSPIVRTPKLLLAVASGADVVVKKFIDDPTVVAADACPAVEADNGGVIPASTIRQSILKYRDTGLPFAGRIFYTTPISNVNQRTQLNAILRACGGTVGKTKEKAVAIADKDIDRVYSAILRGEPIG